MTPPLRRIATLLPALLPAALGCGGDADPDAGRDADADHPVLDVSSHCDPSPATDVRWVSLAGGDFAMGCSPGDDSCDASELPVHAVRIAAFELTEAEITQAQYLAGTGEAPSRYDGCPDCPVDSVRWEDAAAFCATLGGRLPTEAEWEYAARGGLTTRYGCGDGTNCLDVSAWYFDNAGGETHPVGGKRPNGYCLFDMYGNVPEWVEDCWHDDYAGAPADGGAWIETDCTYRVARGGAFGMDALGLRASSRTGDYPDIYFLAAPGFRCARDVP
jgi:formylglycine-generating enzyme required for sulfatase activity